MASGVSGKTFDMNVFGRMMSYARPYKGLFAWTFFLILVLSILGPVRPFLINKMVQGPIKEGNYESLIQWTILIVFLLVLEGVFQFYQTYSANKLGQNVIKDIRVGLFEHLVSFKLKYFDRTPVGKLVARSVSDIETIASVFSSGILVIIGDLLKLVLVIGFMLYMNWKLTLLVLVPIPVLLIATRIFKNAIEKANRKVRKEVSRLSTFVQEHISGMSIVQVFGREKEEERRFQAINGEHRKAHINTVWAYSIFFPIVEILSAASVAFLIWWGLKGVETGYSDPYESFGEVLAFILYIQMLYRPIRQLADRFNTLQMGMVGSERVFEVLDTEAAMNQTGDRQDVDIKGNISFKDVWLAYEGDEHVLKGISLEIKEGENIAFVGSTGAGKSSIISLIGRFYDFQKGKIELEGVDIRSIATDSLRKHLAVVQQDVFLFSDSIHNNITLGDESISREEVIEASKVVGAHDFVMKLPGGYDFDVAERGRTLSVGQRQLISFIRAYVTKPEILILDEATSSIDSESEEMIQRAQEVITKDRTSIVIAHRLSTIKRADMIYVLDRGEIIEKGTHDELLEKGGRYQRLYQLQFN